MQTTITNIENFASLIHSPVYWVDQFGVISGANKAAIQSFGYDSLDEFIGKKMCHLFSDEMGKATPQIYEQIIKTGKVHKHKEFFTNIKTGLMHGYKSVKSPLHDDDNNLVGFISVSVELSSEESYLPSKKPGFLKCLDIISETLPVRLYWKDTNSVVLGANEFVAKSIGAKSTKEIIGKRPYEFYPYEVADNIVQHNNEVMRTEQVLSQEEMINDISTGEIKYFWSIKAPLRDDDGNVIGIIGTSIETTAEKEAALLKLEKERQQIALLEEKEKLIVLAHTVAHDINSPLSALSMMMHACDELPEKKRTVIKRATESILDIANNLLSTYRNEEQRATSDIEQPQPVLISDLIVQLLSEKKAQYSNHAIHFETIIANDAQFAFAHLQASQFRRSVSNLINNAVDALDNKENGIVTIQLTADADGVVVSIQDNGKGMPASTIEKMLHRQSFTEGKQHGHGLGLQQVWDTLDYNHGKMTVNSTPGKRTTIQLTFPLIDAASWIAQTIHLELNSIIVILDDDESIHGAWDTRFAPYLKLYPTLSVHHFKQGQEALDFFNALNPEDKNRTVFLSDYELLRQKKNGLQIIEESGITNTTLVTSYYANHQIRDTAIQLNVKILPKQMASVVPIDVRLPTEPVRNQISTFNQRITRYLRQFLSKR